MGWPPRCAGRGSDHVHMVVLVGPDIWRLSDSGQCLMGHCFVSGRPAEVPLQRLQTACFRVSCKRSNGCQCAFVSAGLASWLHVGPLVLMTYVSDELLTARLTVPLSPQSGHAGFLLSPPAECSVQTHRSSGSVSQRPGERAALSTRCGCSARGCGCPPQILGSRPLTGRQARTPPPPTSSGPLQVCVSASRHFSHFQKRSLNRRLRSDVLPSDPQLTRHGDRLIVFTCSNSSLLW